MSNVLTAQTHQICTKVKDPLSSATCESFDGVTVTVKDRWGNTICSGTTSGGDYCCTVDASFFPIEICTEVVCPFDGECINEFDVNYLEEYLVGLQPGTPGDFVYWADINGDGVINLLDAYHLNQIVNGNPAYFPPSFCRIVSPFCKSLTPPIPAGCYTGCQSLSNPNDYNLDFWLCYLGDLHMPCVDSDCLKPIKEDDPPSLRLESANGDGVTASFVQEAGMLECNIDQRSSTRMKFTLVDIHGKIWLDETDYGIENKTRKSFDLSGFKNGVYFLKVETSMDSEPYIKKILVVRP